MRNPERTTKAERRLAKRYTPFVARTLGVAEAARYLREGIIIDEATGLDRLALALLHDRLDGAGTLTIPASMAPPVDDVALAAWAKATAEMVGDAVLAKYGLGDRYTVAYDHQGGNPHITYPFEPHVELYRGDPNEADAALAEAIENALADDFDDEAGHHG